MIKSLTNKYFLLTLLCFISITKSYGQTVAKNYYGRIVVEFTKEKRPKKFYAKVEIKSAFTGGDAAWVKSIEKNINQSIGDFKRVKKGKHIVSVKFILSRDGSFSDVACENDPGFGLCDVVVRTIRKSHKWAPAEPVKVREFRVSH